MFLIIGVLCFTILLLYFWLKPYLSPLRNLPEPHAWPFLGHTPNFFLNEDHISLLGRWSEEFQEEGLFKTRSLFHGHEAVHVVKTEWAKYMWQHPDLFRRTNFIRTYFPLMKNGLFLAEGEDHRFQKKILSKAFSKTSMENYVPIFDKHANEWIEIFKSLVKEHKDGENIDVRQYTNNFSFNILGEIALGYRFDSKQATPGSYIEAMKKQCSALRNLKVRILLGLFPFLRDFPGIKEIVKGEDGEKQLNDVLLTRKTRYEDGSLTEFEKKDLLSIMMEERDEKTGNMFTGKQIKDNCFTFMLAGYETTASAIPIVLYHLAQYPEMQEKARGEVQDKLSAKEGLLDHGDLDLPYLSAFIKESLRYFPVVSSSQRISVNDCTFGEYHIPKGTILFIYTTHLNKDPEQFDYPDEFIPERFLPDSDIKGGTILTFGYGPFSCIGKTFALLEMRVMIARLLQQFRFTVDDEYNEKFTEKKQFLTIQTTPAIIIRFHELNKGNHD